MDKVSQGIKLIIDHGRKRRKQGEKKNSFNKRQKAEHDPNDDQLPVGPPSYDPPPDPECFQGQYKQRKRARIAAKRNGHMRMFTSSDAPQE